MDSYNHNTGSFSGKGGVEIFFQKWLVENAKAVLIIVHGLGEHSGRYNNLVSAFGGKNISVFAIDHRGHGKSQGKKGHIDSFMDYVYDLKLFVEYVKEENRGLPVVLYGHSMGGVIAAKYALTYSDDPSVVVLSSPGFAPAFTVPGWKKSVAAFFSSRIGSLTMPNGLSSSDISRDNEVVKAYDNDPLVHNKVSARWFTEYMKTGDDCMANAHSLMKPLLVFHGKGDKIADCKASEEFGRKAGSSSKEILLYNEMYHELINEPEADRTRVLKDVVSWVLTQIEGLKKPASVKSSAKKSAVKKAAPVKAAAKAKKPAAKKASAEKPAAKKAAPVKAAAKAKKPAVKKASAVKAAAKKVSAAKPAAKKAVKAVKAEPKAKTKTIVKKASQAKKSTAKKK